MVFSNFWKRFVMIKVNKESNRWIPGIHNCKTKINIRFSYGAGREARYSDIRTYRKQFVVYERLTIHARKVFALLFSVVTKNNQSFINQLCLYLIICNKQQCNILETRVALVVYDVWWVEQVYKTANKWIPSFRLGTHTQASYIAVFSDSLWLGRTWDLIKQKRSLFFIGW